jgi:predicted PhzF superfamily epimerase YddE/YHI9
MRDAALAAGRNGARRLKGRPMRIPIYQVDAFTSRLFRGNPAAVCPLEAWLDDATMQAIAMENNLSETAFFVTSETPLRIRWFTPTNEIDLCGHATLAAASVYLDTLAPDRHEVTFESASGPLVVRQDEEMFVLDFPSRPARPATPPPALIEALGAHALEWSKARDWLGVFGSEADVVALRPDFGTLAAFDKVIVTAPGTESDFVSRFFAPSDGVNEDPVTGSSHCTLTPYWAKRLGRARLSARQVSARGGELLCEDRGERVSIAGRVVRYMEGYLRVV